MTARRMTPRAGYLQAEALFFVASDGATLRQLRWRWPATSRMGTGPLMARSGHVSAVGGQYVRVSVDVPQRHRPGNA